MANFLQYQAAPAQVQGGPGLRQKPPQPGVNPAMVAYLSSGSPQRQLFSQMLSTRPPGGPTGVYTAPPVRGGPTGVYGAPTGPAPKEEAPEQPYAGPPRQPAQTQPTPNQAPPPSASDDFDEGDYLSDSFLQRLLAQRDADLKIRRGGAFSSYQNALLGFGSQEMVRETLGRLLSHPEYRDASGVENPD